MVLFSSFKQVSIILGQSPYNLHSCRQFLGRYNSHYCCCFTNHYQSHHHYPLALPSLFSYYFTWCYFFFLVSAICVLSFVYFKQSLTTKFLVGRSALSLRLALNMSSRILSQRRVLVMQGTGPIQGQIVTHFSSLSKSPHKL